MGPPPLVPHLLREAERRRLGPFPVPLKHLVADEGEPMAGRAALTLPSVRPGPGPPGGGRPALSSPCSVHILLVASVVLDPGVQAAPRALQKQSPRFSF